MHHIRSYISVREFDYYEDLDYRYNCYLEYVDNCWNLICIY